MVELHMEANAADRLDLVWNVRFHHTVAVGRKLVLFDLRLEDTVSQLSLQDDDPGPGSGLGSVGFEQAGTVSSVNSGLLA